MRNLLITGLVILNVALAIAVMFQISKTPSAEAQAIGMSANFIMVSGAIIGSKADIVYVIDLENRQLTSLYYDRAGNNVTELGTRDLVRDLSGVTTKGRTGEPRKKRTNRTPNKSR